MPAANRIFPKPLENTGPNSSPIEHRETEREVQDDQVQCNLKRSGERTEAQRVGRSVPEQNLALYRQFSDSISLCQAVCDARPQKVKFQASFNFHVLKI